MICSVLKWPLRCRVATPPPSPLSAAAPKSLVVLAGALACCCRATARTLQPHFALQTIANGTLLARTAALVRAAVQLHAPQDIAAGCQLAYGLRLATSNAARISFVRLFARRSIARLQLCYQNWNACPISGEQ